MHLETKINLRWQNRKKFLKWEVNKRRRVLRALIRSKKEKMKIHNKLRETSKMPTRRRVRTAKESLKMAPYKLAMYS
jgi:hypothetical protein